MLIPSNPLIRCSYTFACNNSSEIIHMKFERFTAETYYDFLIIGNPHAFETADLVSVDYLNEFFDYHDDYLLTGKALILDGSQPTGIWATATSIQNFDIYFHRMVFKSN